MKECPQSGCFAIQISLVVIANEVKQSRLKLNGLTSIWIATASPRDDYMVSLPARGAGERSETEGL